MKKLPLFPVPKGPGRVKVVPKKVTSSKIGSFAEGGRVLRELNYSKFGDDAPESGRAEDEMLQLSDSSYGGQRILARQQDYNEQMTDKEHNRYYARRGRGPVKRSN